MSPYNLHARAPKPVKPARKNANKVVKPNPKKRVRLLPNGLVSLDKTPELLVANVIHNSSSRLLSLPPELRIKIFELALGSHRVQRPECGTLASNFSAYTGGSRDAIKWTHRCALPLVCRQIYSETATLAYSVNCFGFWTETEMQTWIHRRSAAQLEAVRILGVPYMTIQLETHVLDVFPNLKAVVAEYEDGHLADAGEEWVEKIERVVGKGVKAILRIRDGLGWSKEPFRYVDPETGVEGMDIFDFV